MGEANDILLRMLAATAAGMLLGLNRDLHGKPTGMRTLGLVGLCTCAVTSAALSLDLHLHLASATVGSVMQGILTGIGFLGAGTIMSDTPGARVHGLTTAATVFVTAATGVVFGLGDWYVGAWGVGLALITLLFAGRCERYLRHKFRGLQGEGEDATPDPGERPDS
jgi:putative Mg2+ transporter-C (MgtC) family protein